MKREIIIIVLIFLILISISRVYAFSPGPMAGIPELYILQNSSEIIVEEYTTDIKISESIAKVNTIIKLKYMGETSNKFNFSLNIRKEQIDVDVLLNNKLFNYSYQNKDFTYEFNPSENLLIITNYNLSTNYGFSGPPGSWVNGYAFEVYRSPVREERWRSKTVSACKVNVTFPNDFEIEPDELRYYQKLKIEKLENETIYTIKTESECPYFKFSKITSSEESIIFTDGASKSSLLVYLIIIIALIITCFFIFYKFKNLKKR